MRTLNIIISMILIYESIGFQHVMNSNNNLNLKKNTKPIDRKINAKYLIDKRKSEKILRQNKIIQLVLNELSINLLHCVISSLLIQLINL